MSTKNLLLISASVLVIAAAGCKTKHEIQTVSRIEPIHITMDINLNLKIDKDLDKSVSEAQTQSAWQERKPKIDALKAAGTIGECNNGLLGPAPGASLDSDAFALISAANADRVKMFETIAANQNTTPDTVAKRRAKRVAEDAPIGVFIQDEEGAWAKKE